MSEAYTATILIVDDNIGARRSMEGLLASEGYELLLAENGIQALDIARSEHPDLILLDVMMPGKNGFEVCNEIRKDKEIEEIPIILITALEDDESMIKGIEAGADDFLTKPINKLELRSRVRGISRLNRYRKLCGERLKFEWVVKNSQFGYVLLDEKDRITFSNPKAREMLQLSEEAINANPIFFDTVKDKYICKPDKIKELWSSPPRPEIQEFDPFILIQAQTENDPVHWVKVTILGLEQMALDTKLVRMEDITESMLSFQEKHTFSRMMSHKLLTPLNALKAAQQMMGASAEAEISGLFKRVSNLQKKGIDRLEYDIESILRFLESNTSNGTAETTTLKQLEDQLRSIGEEDGMPFCLLADLGEKESWRTNISNFKFEACVREILENSVKFHSNGSPTILCSIQVLNTENKAIFTFENDGEPISQAELENAWKPYWQADRFLTGEVHGMGLGLPLIATNIWGAGGTCSLANREDTQGAILTLTLPIFE